MDVLESAGVSEFAGDEEGVELGERSFLRARRFDPGILRV